MQFYKKASKIALFVQIKLLLPEMFSYYFTYELISFLKLALCAFFYKHIRIPTKKDK